MRKLTNKHKLAITNLMFAELASYINVYCMSNTDTNNTKMYCADVTHNNNALMQFNADNNAMQLHNSIMQQDTLVREHFIEVLQYIEENNLIPADRFCCI